MQDNKEVDNVKNWMVEQLTNLSKCNDISTDTVLDSLGIKSIQFMQLVGNMEEKFDLLIDPGTLYDMATVGELCDFITNERNEKRMEVS